MMDPRRLSQAICQEFETATTKCAGFKDKDIVLLIGCCGSGKTTVTSYALGTSFRYNRRTGKLEAENPMEGFVMSGQCADVTRGLMAAEVPNTGGTLMVDNAGTGATEGTIAEVCGAINRSLALQFARSVRVVLVIKEARGDVGNERGRVLLKDVEHVASMFCRLENLTSVGLIVTSEPRGLLVDGVASEVSQSMCANFKELLETALAEDEYVDLGAETQAHMKTTAAGKRLLEHLCSSCEKACRIADALVEGDDHLFLAQVCSERVTIFPVNVLQEQQRHSMQTWLCNLPAIQSPGETLKYVLLSDAKKDLEQALSKSFLDCKHFIGERGLSWASDDGLVSKILDVLNLTQTLEETELMPSAQSYRSDLISQLVSQNERVASAVLEGVRSGNPEKIEGVWPAMLKMDSFKQSCGRIKFPGWMSQNAVMTKGMVVAKESLDRHLPGGVVDARWDLNLALQVKGILAAVRQLEPMGAEVLKGWAFALCDHVKALEKAASECKSAASAIQALKCLEEHREFLPRTLVPILGPYGCQVLEGDGLSVAEEAGKEALLASLNALSNKMVEAVLQSGSPAASEQLLQLCRSTELNALLGKDLEDEYILKPMSVKLAPSQGDIDDLAKKMESSHTGDDWHSQLLSINERISAAGEHGSRVLSSVDLRLDDFSAAAGRRISKNKDAVTEAIKKLLSPKCVPEYERSWAALSVNEIPEDLQETDSDRDVVEEAEAAIAELELLLPVDTLLKAMRANLKVQTETVTVAFVRVAWNLNKHLSDALKRTIRRARDKAFIPTHSLGAEIIRALRQVKALATLADTLAKALRSLQDHGCSNMAEKLSSSVESTNKFVDDLVKKELEEWAQADTKKNGWRELFNRHLKMANLLRSLDNDHGHVRSAFSALFQKVNLWREECIKEATEALETGGFLENPSAWLRFVQSCIKEGLAFEQSELCEQLGFQSQFRPMVEAQCEICSQEAASTQQNLKLAIWQKLTTLISALQQLQSEDPRVKKWVQSLMESREPLNVALGDDESRFEKALGEGRFSQAAQLLQKVPSRQRHGDRLKEHLLEAMSSASKRIDDDTEVEKLISAVEDARGLIKAVDGMEDSEMATYAKNLRGELDQKLARKSEDSELQLQQALDGRHAPSCALQLRAKMIKKSKQDTAREAISEFARKKKQAFATMNVSDLVTWIITHDRVWKNLPEEFKNQSEDYAEMLQEFQKCFEKVFTTDFQAMYGYLEEKHWAQARQVYQDLKSSLDDIVNVEILRSFRSFKKLQTKLNGSAGRSRCTLAKDDIKKGEFYEAICVVVTSNFEKEEVELLEMTNEQVRKNLRVSTDPAALHERMLFLGNFLEAVGENPPDELVGLSREVNQAYQKARPQMEQKASAAVSQVLEATATTDLTALASALANFSHFEGGVGVTEEQQKNVVKAKQEFWKQMKDGCNKVGTCIETLDVNGLSLNLERLGVWLVSFAALCDNKKQALLDPNSPDLEAWMRDFLAEPLRRLLDPTSLMNLVDSRQFTDISRRRNASQKLKAVLKTELLDLTGVEEYLLQRKEVARKALDSTNFQQFNSEVKVCKLVCEELVEVPAAQKILAEMENDLRERFLNRHLSKLRSGQNIPDVAAASQEVRKVANSAPDTYEWVTTVLEDAFQDLQNNAAFNVQGLAALGMKLAKTPLGQTIVAEHPGFFGAVKDMQSNELFRRAGESQNLGDIVGALTRESGLDGDEYHELVAALQNHEVQFGHLKNKYLNEQGGRSLEAILEEAKHDLDLAVQACNGQDRTAETVMTLVAHLSICFTLVRSGKKYLEAPVSEQEQKLVIPHKAQILTLFRFLQCHKHSADTFWKKLCNVSKWVQEKVCGPRDNSQPENHLAQVLTGEGKCLTLGLLASFLALNGVESDVICYRKLLTEQDGQFMQPFFKFLGVEKMIRYLTFDELCEERLAHIRQASKELVENGTVTAGRQESKLANRACLIDEVDVLFARRFYGNTWDGGFKLTSPQAVKLVEHIFSTVTGGHPIRNITATDEFQDLLKAYPEEMGGVLTDLATVLVQNVEGWSKPEPILDERSGKIGYKEKDEVSYDVSYCNKTAFAYLDFLKDGKLKAEQVCAHVGIDLLCGRFSFADLPNSYRCILGVTGTLNELRGIGGFEKMLRVEYGFKHFTITPSIFGSGLLDFNPGEHVKVLDEEKDWCLCIERLVHEYTKRGDSVLVFFKNEIEMRKYPGWTNMECLTERTDPKRRKGYIAAATAEGKTTLLTKAYGRGIDFQMPEKHRLVVLQTYLSSLVSEEKQIKGRTARQGKSGLFLQVLCGQHLQGKMGFSEEEVNSLRNVKGERVGSLLKAKQTAKTSAKVFGMVERRNKARHLETETKEWERLLFGPADKSQKLKKLASFNELWVPVHYTVLLDISSSMLGERKQQMDVAFSRFREQLCQQEQEGSDTMVSPVLFNHDTQVIAPSHAKASELQDISHRQVGGGTCFHKAFAACRSLISRSSRSQELILFLTDGCAPFPESEVTALLAEHGSRIKCLTCVALGAGADTRVLKQIGAKFQEQNINFKLHGVDSQETLVTAFKEAAGGRAIHCK